MVGYNRSSQTMTTTATITTETLALQEPRPHVTWATGTVDNEGAGKKKSKKCCIFKKRRNFDESSSDSDHECGKS